MKSPPKTNLWEHNSLQLCFTSIWSWNTQVKVGPIETLITSYHFLKKGLWHTTVTVYSYQAAKMSKLSFSPPILIVWMDDSKLCWRQQLFVRKYTSFYDVCGCPFRATLSPSSTLLSSIHTAQSWYLDLEHSHGLFIVPNNQLMSNMYNLTDKTNQGTDLSRWF